MPREQYYEHPETGQLSHFPWGAEQARKKRAPRYQSEDPCPDCGARTPVRFTRSDVCQNCVLQDVTKLQRWTEGGMQGVMPLIALEIYDTDGESPLRHSHRQPCIYGPHFHMANVNGECINCDREKVALAKVATKGTPRREGRARSPDVEMALAAPDMILSRADARLLGLKVFRTGGVCQKGHRGWRYTSTGGCLDCKLQD